jgi:hypothetical protein
MKKCSKLYSLSGILWSVIFFIFVFFLFLYKVNLDYIAVISGWIIAFLNVLAGVSVISKSLDKSNKKFLVILFGNMAIRMFLVIIVFVLLMVVFKFNDLSLTFSLFINYFVFLIFEIGFLLCKIKSDNINKI